MVRHLAQISNEFVKIAARWDELPLESQQSYLGRHPKSRRKLLPKDRVNQLIEALKKSNRYLGVDRFTDNYVVHYLDKHGEKAEKIITNS